MSLRSVLTASALLTFLVSPVRAQNSYIQENLVSNLPGQAENLDPNLVNAWGIAESSSSPFWISNNGTGTSTLYNSAGNPFPVGNPLVVNIPRLVTSDFTHGSPTGIVFNSDTNTTDFLVNGKPASFIFATEDGTLSAWNGPSGTQAALAVEQPAASYVGLAQATDGSSTYLYAANLKGGIAVFDKNYAETTLAGNFTDPNLPKGFAPYNIQAIGNKLYVAYAKLATSPGPPIQFGLGTGYVDVFNTDGTFDSRFASAGTLNAPWGLAKAPGNFGAFSNDILVGNLGDGRINAYTANGHFVGQLDDTKGNPISIDGLWGLQVGNGKLGGDASSLYFTAGPDGYSNGLFGRLSVVPEPSVFALFGAGLLSFLKRKRHIS
ncbi:MAG: TIGR03118 family protein [Verrucomicrobia bacterium]|nr:TIGR03118 family protein [Verrucomicrobiota bacterium]